MAVAMREGKTSEFIELALVLYFDRFPIVDQGTHESGEMDADEYAYALKQRTKVREPTFSIILTLTSDQYRQLLMNCVYMGTLRVQNAGLRLPHGMRTCPLKRTGE